MSTNVDRALGIRFIRNAQQLELLELLSSINNFRFCHHSIIVMGFDLLNHLALASELIRWELLECGLTCLLIPFSIHLFEVDFEKSIQLENIYRIYLRIDCFWK